MNYWQFKYNLTKGSFSELKDLQDGDVFFTEITENHILKEVGIDTVVFWSRTDKEKGIMLVTKINGEPYESDVVSSGKAIPMKVIKKFDKPFSLEQNGFKILHNKLNTLKYKGRVRSRAKIDNETGAKLVKKILADDKEPSVNLDTINEESIKNTINLFLDNYSQYIEDGKNGAFYNIFIEANIAGQEIRHSSYLANLLDKDGNHFQDNLFLKSFINELKEYQDLESCETIIKFDTNNYKVTTEEFHKNEESTGLMDIVLEDDNYAIIIENKTGTKDSKGQLVKYKNFAQSKGLKDYIILYLTPKGDIATDEDARDDDKIVSISYIKTIKNTMEKSLSKISNKKLTDIIEQYIESIQLYTYNLSIDWKYELNSLELIIENKNISEQCQIISKLVNYNMFDKYNTFSKEEIDMAKWITKCFIKSKSHLERLFFVNLHNEIRDILESKSFYFSKYSNILSELLQNENNIAISIATDIETIYKSRQNRLSGIPNNKSEEYYQKLRENSKSCLVYENIIDDNEVLFLSIQKDVSGLYVFIERLTDNEIILMTEVTYLYDSVQDIFHPQEIEKLLNENYLLEKVEESKLKIISAIMEIN